MGCQREERKKRRRREEKRKQERKTRTRKRTNRRLPRKVSCCPYVRPSDPSVGRCFAHTQLTAPPSLPDGFNCRQGCLRMDTYRVRGCRKANPALRNSLSRARRAASLPASQPSQSSQPVYLQTGVPPSLKRTFSGSIFFPFLPSTDTHTGRQTGRRSSLAKSESNPWITLFHHPHPSAMSSTTPVQRVLLLVGPPGSGKSTFAKALIRDFPVKHIPPSSTLLPLQSRPQPRLLCTPTALDP